MARHLSVAELDALRTGHESDNEWRVRRMFLERHCADYPLDYLQCLASVFINVNFLGCKYSEELMDKVREMGAGILEQTNQSYRRTFNNGTHMRGAASSATNATPTDIPPRKFRRIINNEALKEQKTKNFLHLRSQVKNTNNNKNNGNEDRTDALQSLNQAISRAKMAWELIEANTEGFTVVTIDGVVVLRAKFPNNNCKTANIKQCAAIATLSALSSDNIEIRNTCGVLEFWHNKIGPSECYSDYVVGKLHKAAKMLPERGSAYAKLEKALQLVNTPLEFVAEQSFGWKERIAFMMLNVELASAVLKKSECTKAREAQRKEELANYVISMIRSPTLKLVETTERLTIDI